MTSKLFSFSGGCIGGDAFWEPSTAAVRAVGFEWDLDAT